MTDSARETAPATERGPFWDKCSDSTARDRRNSVRLLIAALVWTIVLFAATLLIKKGLVPAGPVAWAVAALPSAAGLFVGLGFARFLREGDELQRAIQLQALALGFGAGLFAISGYQLFERLGAPAASAADYMLVMIIVYMIGIVLGRRRYR